MKFIVKKTYICNAKSFYRITNNMENNKVQEIDNRSKHEMMLLDTSKQNIFDANYSVILNLKPYIEHVPFGIPMRSKEHRLMLVTSGESEHSFNFTDYKLRPSNLLIMPKNYIFSIESMSDDFDAKIITFDFETADLALLITYEITYLELNAKETSIINSYISLIGELLDQPETSAEYITPLILSLLYYVKKLNISKNGGVVPEMTNSKIVCNRFLEELMQNDAPPVRDVAFYSERLCVTDNYLYQSVKKHTKNTVMHWINSKTVAYIKRYLCDQNKKLSLDKIAEDVYLNNASQLSRFFKRETGLTPAEYRKQKGASIEV